LLTVNQKNIHIKFLKFKNNFLSGVCLTVNLFLF